MTVTRETSLITHGPLDPSNLKGFLHALSGILIPRIALQVLIVTHDGNAYSASHFLFLISSNGNSFLWVLQ